MASDSLGCLAAEAGVGAAVGAANQIAVDTALGQKNPGTTTWLTGGLAAGLGLVGALALPKRARMWRDVADGLAVSGLTLLGQVGTYDLDRALDRVAKPSGGATEQSLPITLSSSSGGAVSTSNAASSGSTLTYFGSTNYADLP